MKPGLSNPGRLHIGTSGWSYAHWAGPFYPQETKPDKYLEFYQTRFDCTELNSCFYHLPREETVAGWMRRTPESFRFCLKLSRFITHQRRLKQIDEAMAKFFGLFDSMIPRLGPVLVQLPPGLSYDLPLLADFLQLTKESYPSYRFAIEARHPSWFRSEFSDLLSHYRTTFVIADSGYRFPEREIVTSHEVYLRFHGREQLYASDYPEPVLRDFADKIRDWMEEGKEVWVFFNNDFQGYAVKNALQLKNMLELQ